MDRHHGRDLRGTDFCGVGWPQHLCADARPRDGDLRRSQIPLCPLCLCG